MDELFGLNQVDAYVYGVLLIDLVIAVAMICCLRFLTGLVADVNSTEELASRDNLAFGIAMAGGTLSLALMLTGAVSGEPGATYLSEIINVVGYGVVGLVLIKVGRLVQDKLILTGIEIQQEIKAGNLSAAIVEVGNTLAIGLVLRAVMLWVESDTLSGLLSVLAAFVITQLLLTGVTKYRLVVYGRRHEGGSLQEAFSTGNVALSVRFFGHLTGVALALTAASGVIAYNSDTLLTLAIALASWAAVTVIFAVLVSVLSAIARSVILMGVNVVEEVDQQRNVGVAAIEASIYISIGLFFTALFA